MGSQRVVSDATSSCTWELCEKGCECGDNGMLYHRRGWKKQLGPKRSVRISQNSGFEAWCAMGKWSIYEFLSKYLLATQFEAIFPTYSSGHLFASWSVSLYFSLCGGTGWIWPTVFSWYLGTKHRFSNDGQIKLWATWPDLIANSSLSRRLGGRLPWDPSSWNGPLFPSEKAVL